MDAPLTGPGNAISVAFDQTTTCNVSLTVTDVYGQTASPSENITLLINPGQGPAPVINDGSGSVNATAGTPLTLSGSGTTCPTGNCTTYWSLACPNSRGSFANRTGASIMVTSGGNASFDINTAGASSAFDCEPLMRGRAGCRPQLLSCHGMTCALSSAGTCLLWQGKNRRGNRTPGCRAHVCDWRVATRQQRDGGSRHPAAPPQTQARST